MTPSSTYLEKFKPENFVEIFSKLKALKCKNEKKWIQFPEVVNYSYLSLGGK